MIDRFLRWMESLPGTSIPWLVVFGLVLAVIANVPPWLAGEREVGHLEPTFLSPALSLAYFLGLVDVLDRIARSAFDEFRPALGGTEQEQDRLRAELTRIPDRSGFVAIILFTVVLSLGYSLDPVSASQTATLPPTVNVMTIILWLPVTAAVALVVLHTLRQLRLVARLHEMAAHVDLLDPAPTNAFSKLTAATAIGILGIGLLFALPEVESTAVSIVELVGALAFTALAIVSFVVPLRGMHGRLAAEKDRRLAETNARLKLVQARLHAAVDGDDLSRADDIQKTQTALLAERDLYSHLSTWPWSQGTFRGFASAVVLPIVLGVALRILQRYV